jgi:D-sedoheptulose 7-phosphate isomerase
MELIDSYLSDLTKVIEKLPAKTITALITTLAEARDQRRHIFVMGNGGSAATASHAVNDLTKLAQQEGKPRLRVIALTDNVPIMMAFANDVDYSRIFVEQLMALAEADDVLIGISGSGNSPNILKAMEWAKENGLKTMALTGQGGGRLKYRAELSLVVPSDSMTHIEDIHLILCHIISLGLRDA